MVSEFYRSIHQSHVLQQETGQGFIGRRRGRLVGFGQRIGDFGQVKLPLLVDDQIQRLAFKSEIRKSPCPADKTFKLGIDE